MDNTYRQTEMQINLKEVIWDLLEQWKAVLIVALVLAVLVPGLKLIKDNKAYEANKATQQEIEDQTGIPTDERIESILEPLTEEDKAAVNFALRQKEWVKIQKDYLNNSILISVDPTNQRTLLLEYIIEDQVGGNMPALIYGYIGVAKSDEAINVLGNAIDPSMDNKYIAELINVNLNRYTSIDVDAKYFVLEIRIVMPEEIDVTAVESAVSSVLKQQSETIVTNVGEHSIKLIDAYETRQFNTDAVNNRNNITNNITNVQNAIKNSESTLSDEAKSAIEAIESVKAAENPNETEDLMTEAVDEAIRPGFNKKYAVLGFVLGTMAYAFVYLLWIIFSAKLRYASDVEYYTGSRLLGTIYTKAEPKGLDFLLCSKTVDSFRYRGMPDEETQLNKTLSSLEAASEHAGAKHISLFAFGDVKDIADKIKTALVKKGINAEVIKVSESIDEKELLEKEYAVYVMDNNTKVSDLGQLASLFADYEVKTLGSIYKKNI